MSEVKTAREFSAGYVMELEFLICQDCKIKIPALSIFYLDKTKIPNESICKRCAEARLIIYNIEPSLMDRKIR